DMSGRRKAQPEVSVKVLADHMGKQEQIKAKRTGKDSVFTHLFSEAEYRFQLFQSLHPELKDVAMDDIIPLTITNVVIDRPYNDLAILAGKTLLILVEAQATWSINILIRFLMYLAQIYSDYINANKLDIYGTNAIPLPEPEFYVIYTGNRRDRPEKLNFRVEFFDGKDVAIDATAKVIYDGEHGNIINQYVTFCRVLDEQYKKFGRTAEAIRETIRICKDKNVLREYLQRHEREVMGIMLTLFDQETAINNRIATVERETRVDERLMNIKNLMRNMKLSAQEAMSALSIPSDQQTLYAAQL
ncbi:MAG: hypothetical protein IJU98_09300, partial [Synergistaceae bacterium]|nr:hypothetical protein [Synergistaceae bacterium]